MPQKGNHIKALFLLVVFSLNTLVSFACSLGGFFHSFHHSASSSAVEGQHGHHPHKEGHQHHGNASHYDSKPSEKPDDDCCSKNLVTIEKVEKAISRTIQAPEATFLASFLTAFSSLFALLPAEESLPSPDSVRWRIPATIQDLRIVIQSFQI
jgi:hypothetical protein